MIHMRNSVGHSCWTVVWLRHLVHRLTHVLLSLDTSVLVVVISDHAPQVFDGGLFNLHHRHPASLSPACVGPLAQARHGGLPDHRFGIASVSSRPVAYRCGQTAFRLKHRAEPEFRATRHPPDCDRQIHDSTLYVITQSVLLSGFNMRSQLHGSRRLSATTPTTFRSSRRCRRRRGRVVLTAATIPCITLCKCQDFWI